MLYYVCSFIYVLCIRILYKLDPMDLENFLIKKLGDGIDAAVPLVNNIYADNTARHVDVVCSVYMCMHIKLAVFHSF